MESLGVQLELKNSTHEEQLGTDFHLKAVVSPAQVTHASNKWEHLRDDSHREMEKKQKTTNNKKTKTFSFFPSFNYYKHYKDYPWYGPS